MNNFPAEEERPASSKHMAGMKSREIRQLKRNDQRTAEELSLKEQAAEGRGTVFLLQGTPLLDTKEEE